ncbi:hypothetical protein WA026_005407 [Henosepilachna vigintioctopunctata]|uniref:CHK kinase-like domain-containing protein n=1 Tax=Henosepilachna vigintioctopunctata TaxID=420089 RepID=A0AAW1U5C4_9CUCU
MLDSKKPWNLEHSLMVMEEFGKFHAISFALNDQDPELFKYLTRNMTPLQFEYHHVLNLEAYCIGVILESNMKLLKESGRLDLYDKFDKLHSEVYDTINYVVDVEDKRTICHGDCWNNNFMFKYQDENDNQKPTNVKFLDFQLAICHSPVVDLVFNIYSTGDDVTLQNFDLLLETYYKSLSNCIESLGSDPSTLFTYDELRRHWRKYGLFGILMTYTALRLSHFTAEEAPDFIEISEGKKDFMECLTSKGKYEEQCKQRLLNVFTHFGDTFL